jgi:hypothetical protein
VGISRSINEWPKPSFRLSLDRDAAEFLNHKDYFDNWLSEKCMRPFAFGIFNSPPPPRMEALKYRLPDFKFIPEFKGFCRIQGSWKIAL